jgi:hypothetical protein
LRGYSNLLEKFPDIHIDDIFIHHIPPGTSGALVPAPTFLITPWSTGAKTGRIKNQLTLIPAMPVQDITARRAALSPTCRIPSSL